MSTDTSFCSRCGFLLTGIADILQTGGLIPRLTREKVYVPPSPRARGIRQGLFIFLLSFLIVPLLILFSMVTNLRSPALAMFAAIVLVVGGLLRMAYALMFEAPVFAIPALGNTVDEEHFLQTPSNLQIPGQENIPAMAYARPGTGHWRDTNDLEPLSITDGTTRLLENESK